MNSTHEKVYDTEFYKEQVDGSVASAKTVLARLFCLYSPRSVVDFGCGMGGWLSEAEALGAHVLKGFDGDWVDRRSLLSSNIDFTPVDMAGDIHMDSRYDLAISLEVAEHLPPGKSKAFINTLCSASDVVLFGAAIPGQGGVNHVNEQPQSYWLKLFSENGYKCFDIMRGALWNNRNVRWWYKQNTFIFINTSANIPQLDFGKLKSLELPIIDAVHPENLERKIEQTNKFKALASTYREKYVAESEKIQKPPSLRFCLGILKRYLLKKN